MRRPGGRTGDTLANGRLGSAVDRTSAPAFEMAYTVSADLLFGQVGQRCSKPVLKEPQRGYAMSESRYSELVQAREK